MGGVSATALPGWGPPCVKCGHPSGYHGMTWCMHDSGGPAKRQCDCDGYVPLIATTGAPDKRPENWEDKQIHFAFKLDGVLCPRCKCYGLIGYYFRTLEGAHQHTYFVCPLWPAGGQRCGWHGWSVPE